MAGDAKEEAPRIKVYADDTSTRLIQAYSRQPTLFMREFRRPAQRSRKRLIERIGHGLQGEDAARALSDYLVELERSLEAILSAHSVYYWLHLSRRVAPEPIDRLSPWTAFLARRILDMAICKHGLPSTTERTGTEFSIVDGVSRLREVGHFETVQIYAAEYLAYEYWDATARYRVVNKGGILRQDARRFYTDVSDDIRGLLDLKDSRGGRSSLFASVGATDGFASLDRGLALVPVLNVDRNLFPLDAFFALGGLGDSGPMGRFNPNYMPSVLGLQSVMDALAPFESHVVEATGLTPESFCSAIEAILTRAVWKMTRSGDYAYEFLQRGWFIWANDLDEYCADAAACLVSTGREDLDEHSLSSAVRQLISRYSLGSFNQSDISLWTRQPAVLSIPVGEATLIDLSALVHIAIEAAYAVGVQDGAPGGTKGRVFERQVVRALEPLGVALWQCARELHAPGGEVREVDVSFIQGDRLFVVECKAFAHTHRLDKGDYWPTCQRWEQLVAAHNQAETLIDFLKRNPRGSNYAVPQEVTEFVPLVCTPHNEWVASSSEAYWLAPTIPVFCTPTELARYVSDSQAGHAMPPG